MKSFKIFFKDFTTLKVLGVDKEFTKNTACGFKYMSDKDYDNIRKQVLKKGNMVFTLTDNLIGCKQVIYGNKTPVEVTTTNLIKLNKGKKNKDKSKLTPKIEAKLGTLNPGQEDSIIAPESEEMNDEVR